MSFMNQMAPKYVLAPRKKYLGASWLLEFLPNFEPCITQGQLGVVDDLVSPAEWWASSWAAP